ncbi:MAG: MBL fold metallo-hydrolase [Planctomycetota bacterium]|nr:MBL fold metallo-hydrolase [Planctomycetota bacterium]
MSQSRVCVTCGTQYPSGTAPELCKICEDDRQYVPVTGQSWTSQDVLRRKHAVRVNRLHEKFYEMEIVPRFAIGQRAFLVMSEGGNVLWDCIPLLDEPTIEFIKSRGGLSAIGFSHPHYYSNMNDWAEAFDCPIYIHRADEQWIVDRGKHVRLWDGDEEALWDGMRIINIGGHFPGSSVLHAPSLSQEGTMFCGDTMNLSPSMKHLAIMYSYPNLMPLPVHEVARVGKRLEAIPFDAVYGFYSYQNLTDNARDVLRESLNRYRE